MPDTGAAGHSTGGYNQYVALQQICPKATLDKTTAGQASIRFGDGQTKRSIGTTAVPTAFGPIQFHIVDANTPFLLCLSDMDRLNIHYNNITDCLVQGKVVRPVVRKWGHPWLLISQQKQTVAYSHLTEVELKRLHRRFGHPTVSRLYQLLKQSDSNIDIQAIEHLT